MKVLIVDGLRFVKDDATGYYRNDKFRTRLHRYLYESEYGELPTDVHVHHADGNKDNNSLENLVAMASSDHSMLHGALLTDEQRQWLRDNLATKARPAACEWHGSDEGRKWHKEHYEQMKDALHAKKRFECKHCGEAFYSNQAGYCSNNCKSAYRRATGIDNITLVCPICGETYETNKYQLAETCSRSCSNRLRWRRKNGQG